MLEKRVFTTAEAAAYLGIAPQTLRLSRSKSPSAAGVKVRGIPFVKVGGRVHYDRDDLDAWLLKQRSGPGAIRSTFGQRSRDGAVFIPRELSQKMAGNGFELAVFLEILAMADSEGRLDIPEKDLARRFPGRGKKNMREALDWLLDEGWLDVVVDTDNGAFVHVANHQRYFA